MAEYKHCINSIQYRVPHSRRKCKVSLLFITLLLTKHIATNYYILDMDFR